MSNQPEKKLFKDWFDKSAAAQLATQIKTVHPAFDSKSFIKEATNELTKLEFQDRVWQFAHTLRSHLPSDTSTALSIIQKSLPPPLPDCESPTDGWLQWPIGHLISHYGLDNWDQSFQLMEKLTQSFTSEFAARPFIEQNQTKALQHLLQLTNHPNPHVRRWTSEASRPRLPWGKLLKNLIHDPSPILPILEQLKDDPELYVRRSVANNLNDIAKDHPNLVIQTCKAWQKTSDPNRTWLIKHALRTLIKDGHPEALELLGYHPPKDLETKLKTNPTKITIGQSLTLNTTIISPKTTNLIIDFAIHFPRQNGKISRKVFKWKTATIEANTPLHLTKKQNFKQTSTRRLYPGSHKIDLQINGQTLTSTTITLNE